MPATAVTVAYLIVGVLFILSLGGLSAQESARRGNLFGIVGMAIAVIATMLGPGVTSYAVLFAMLTVGGLMGAALAARVQMTAMPQLVAILHSFVGAAAVLVDAVKNDLKPRDIVTKQAIENAVAVIMATGGSTNAVLHFLAIAHAAGVPWTIDDFERVRRKVPVLCDLKPSGRFMAIDLHRAGGIPQVMKGLLKAGLLHGDCVTITGQRARPLSVST